MVCAIQFSKRPLAIRHQTQLFSTLFFLLAASCLWLHAIIYNVVSILLILSRCLIQLVHRIQTYFDKSESFYSSWKAEGKLISLTHGQTHVITCGSRNGHAVCCVNGIRPHPTHSQILLLPGIVNYSWCWMNLANVFPLIVLMR